MALSLAGGARRAASGALGRLAALPWPAIAAFIGAAPVFALLALALFGASEGDGMRSVGHAGALLATTLGLAFVTGVGVAMLGAGAAWLVAGFRFPGRNVFDWALMLPLAAPAYLLAYAYADLTAAAGPLQGALRAVTGWRTRDYWFPETRGLLGAAFVFAVSLYPYVYIVARRAFADQAASLFEAARTLGRGPRALFLDIALPLARPALVAGGALAVIEALADYGAVAHLGVRTLTTGVIRAWSSGGEPVAAARLGLVLAVMCGALLWVERRGRGRARVAPTARSLRTRPPRTLTGVWGWVAAAACALPILLGLIVPSGWMALLALAEPGGVELFAAAGRSLALAATAAILAASVALGLAGAARLGDPASRLAIRVASAGYAIPGAVAALGALTLMAWLVPLATAAAIPALILAYQTRFAAAALGPVLAAFGRITPSIDGAARALGADRAALARRVHMPLALGGVISGGLIVFVEVLKELPATMILRPFDFQTLAIAAHNYAEDERLAHAAAPALAIVALALPAMAFAARLMRRLDSELT